MKRILLSFALLSAPLLRAQTPFTYQGKLENSGVPYNGNVTIRLGIYGGLTGGTALRSEVIPNVPVSNGLFTVSPNTFNIGEFTGAARFLNVEISPDGSSYTALVPRQQVTFAPYAMHAVSAVQALSAASANTANAATIVTGAVPGSQITGTLSPSLLGTGAVTGTVTFNPASGPPFAVGSNSNKVLNLNADLLDGLDSTAFLRTSGGTLTGDLNFQNTVDANFGNQVRQMLNLYNADYGIGVQASTLYQRSSEDWSWHRLGAHSDVRNNPGTGGTEVMRLSGFDLWLHPNSSSTQKGRVVFGNLNTGNNQPYVSVGESTVDIDTLELIGDRVRVATNTPGKLPVITFGQTTGQHLVLYENSTDVYGIGIQSGTEYFRSGDQFAWYKDGAHTDTALSPGAGGTRLMTLGSTGTLTVSGSENGINVINRQNSGQEWAMYSRNSGTVGQLAFWNNGTGDVAAFSPNGDMYLAGQVSTTVLTIRGGADVAEPFETTRPEELEPGTVVVIDEENPGKLKRSDGAYDTRAAGIVSGAGGVKPGLRLHQEGVMEGDHHVALSGRVYVKADASHGEIKPGDLLTTSSTAGHAMKVKDREKAQGAILGKAMSRLDKGTGLVLVLVTLQ